MNAPIKRRQFLTGVTAAGAVLAGRSSDSALSSAASTLPPPLDEASVTFPFYGTYQAGVDAPTTGAGVAAGLDVRVDSREELQQLLVTISSAIEHVMSARPYEVRAGGYPPLDTGMLGPSPPPTDTSVVLGLGSSLFDDRFGLAGSLPIELQPMPRFRNDYMVEAERSNGDLSLVVNAVDAEAVSHAFRQILRVTRGRLIPRWMQTGFQRIDEDRNPGGAAGRNLLGFKDGTVNPAADDSEAMNAAVWIQPDDDQPDWFVGGTYQAIRLIRMQVEFWDRTRLNEQEAIFFRDRDSGAPLGSENETDVPDFKGDLTSHIARANPRNGSVPDFTMLRRGFNYANGLDGNDQLDEGLVFVSYQRSLETGFIGVQRRLDGEALEEYIRPTGGGLFAVPPAPADGEYLGQSLLES